MNPLKYLIIHCSATPENRSVTAETIRNWHTKPKPVGRGWKAVGYSDLILLDGTRHKFVKHNNDQWVDPYEITNGVEGMNSVARHVCYIGGMTGDGKQAKNTLSHSQNATLSAIIAEVLGYCPTILIGGHNQFANKACPSFFVPHYLQEQCMVKVKPSNIYTSDPFGYAAKMP